MRDSFNFFSNTDFEHKNIYRIFSGQIVINNLCQTYFYIGDFETGAILEGKGWDTYEKQGKGNFWGILR